MVFHATQRMEHRPGLQLIRGRRPPSKKWPVRDRQLSKPPAKTRRSSQVTSEPESSRRGPLPEDGVRRQGSSGEIGGRNGSSGRDGPHFRASTRSTEDSEGPVSSPPCGGPHCLDERFHRTGQEEDRCMPSQSSAGGSCQGPVQVAPGRARFERRGTWRPSCRSLQKVGPEWRKFPRQYLPILPRSSPNCALVSPSCGERIWSCVGHGRLWPDRLWPKPT